MLTRTQHLLAESRPVRVVLYGDSISEVGRTPSWHGGATAPALNWGACLGQLLTARYPGSAFPVAHFAIGGQNSYEGLGRLDGLAAFSPDLVLVAFGANDCGYHFLLPEETQLALTTLVQGIRARVDADCVLVGTGGDNPRHPGFRHLAETLAAQRQAAQELSVPYVDIRQAVLTATADGARWADCHLAADNCHPNDAGHRLWAECAYAVITAALPVAGRGDVTWSDDQPSIASPRL
jgi:lysophospholipase L1-like esterase